MRTLLFILKVHIVIINYFWLTFSCNNCYSIDINILCVYFLFILKVYVIIFKVFVYWLFLFINWYRVDISIFICIFFIYFKNICNNLKLLLIDIFIINKYYFKYKYFMCTLLFLFIVYVVILQIVDNWLSLLLNSIY